MRIKSVLAVLFIAATAFVVGTAVALPITANAESPRLIPYSGHLDQAGTPVSGTRSLQLSIVDAGDVALWTSAARDVTFAAGAFSMVLGESPDPAIPDAVFSTEEIYVTVSVEGTPLVGRQRLYSQPYAIRATSAYEASVGGPLNAELEGLSQSVTALQQSVGTGVAIMNTTSATNVVVDPGTARFIGPNGSGDYRWIGLSTCDPGRMLTIAYVGQTGVLALSHNACGGTSPCAPFLNTSGAAIGLGTNAPPVNYVCVNNRWYQM